LLSQGLEVFNYNEFHHGCCVGADAEAHQLVLAVNNSIPFQIHGHPSNMVKQTAELEGFTIKRAAKNPIDRNQDIVDSVDLLIACPEERNPVLRSGTWSTIRKAQAIHIPVIIIPGDTH
jgi:hypothetical protein